MDIWNQGPIPAVFRKCAIVRAARQVAKQAGTVVVQIIGDRIHPSLASSVMSEAEAATVHESWKIPEPGVALDARFSLLDFSTVS